MIDNHVPPVLPRVMRLRAGDAAAKVSNGCIAIRAFSSGNVTEEKMTFSQRERERVRLVGLRTYYREQGRAREAQGAEEQLAQYPIGGVLPDEPGTLIAHCGQWWPLEGLSWTAPCCGWTLKEKEVCNVRL